MAMPKYVEIQNKLKQEIKSGKFKYGDRFYSEADLKDKFNVSSITVIRALRELVVEGFLVRYQGKGTFVSYSLGDSLVHLSVRGNSINSEKEPYDKMTVLDVVEGNNPTILNKLKLTPNDHYYLVKRIRYKEGQPFAVYFTYLPADEVEDDLLKDKNNFESIFYLLKNKLSIHLEDEPFSDKLTIVHPTEEVSANLKIEPSSLVVNQEKTIVSQTTSTPLYYHVAYIRWDAFSLVFSSPNYPQNN
ncbi:GntR family transcriptional regulator [Lactobacillus sp. PV037]|uniref:GntR family transcriptional regulator n=1 Tax=Lactobacillus sp. PV037 TaxID=2594496 RepID=UPI00223F91F1|nr:GntR family transcriptional regulator [Lactobacillus sp. PV037]QNQ84231.1 GntR family transcriptional regulator [Lactobacillus sp. PV037]